MWTLTSRDAIQQGAARVAVPRCMETISLSITPIHQSTVSLSSGEAEVGGICKGASVGLGLQSVAADLGLNWKLAVHTDATAAIGICRRKGLGKIRHLAVADLWVQERVRSGDFELLKVLGTNNPADMLTKHITREQLVKHSTCLGCKFVGGRPDSAPSL